MNEEIEYSGEAQPTTGLVGSIHLPIALIALALAINFFADWRNANKQAELMRWQLSGLDRQTEALSAGKRELAALIAKNDEVVRQAQQIQGQYTNLFGDLIDLAKEDKDAREIVEKWGIKRQGDGGQPAAPAPAADGNAAPKSDAAPAPESKAPTLR